MSHYDVKSVSGHTASVSFAGIPYADFDRTGRHHYKSHCCHYTKNFYSLIKKDSINFFLKNAFVWPVKSWKKNF